MRASTSLKSLRFAAVLGLMFGALSLGEAGRQSAGAEFLAERARYDGRVAIARGRCRRSRPSSREKESSFWNSPLKIEGFAAVHETAFRPWASDNIPRRYCTGEAMLNDGKMRR